MARHVQYRFAAATTPNAARREWADAVEAAEKDWEKRMTMIQIGIDPGVHTGLAVAEDGKIIRLETLDFWKVYHIVCGLIDEHGSLRVGIEVPKTKANWHGAKAAHDVGRVCRESELLADGLELAGAQVGRIHPLGKVDASTFAQITGWKGSTNPHKRDAGMLAITTTRGRK